jgi:hypothetical protein
MLWLITSNRMAAARAHRLFDEMFVGYLVTWGVKHVMFDG